MGEDGLATVREAEVRWPWTGEGESEGEEKVGGLDRGLWAVLVFADEMTRKVKVGDETFGRVSEVFGERGTVELTAIVSLLKC